MRNLLVVATLAVGCGRAEHYVTIGADAVPAGDRVLATDHGVALLEVDDAQLAALPVHIHQQLDRCGGFILHDSLDDAQAALHAQTLDRGGIDYGLDRAALVEEVLPVLDRTRIRDMIRELSGFGTRYYRSDRGAEVSRWLRDRWRSLTRRTDVTVELFDQGYPQKSVIMTIPGTTRAREVVVIGGHLDSITFGTPRDLAPGADDDASGIATLTEVARVLLANDYRPERTIQFMAYAAEEVGLRGSQAIVRDYKKRGVDVVGVLQLDMTNFRGSDRDIWLIRDFTSSAQNDFLIALLETYVHATWGYDACGYACSDHASWNRAGYRASMPFESRANEMNRKIHSAGDVLEMSDADAAHALQFARLAAAYAIEIGKGNLHGLLAAR